MTIIEHLAIVEPVTAPEYWFGEKYRSIGGLRVDVTAYRTFAQMRAGNTAAALADALAAWLGEGE